MNQMINGMKTAFFSALCLMTLTRCSRDAGPADDEVWIEGYAFTPAIRTIATGTTITWTNRDSYAHTVTSGTPGAPDSIFDSGNLGHNATFSFTFDSAGTYNYYCRYHTGMTGTITVQ